MRRLPTYIVLIACALLLSACTSDADNCREHALALLPRTLMLSGPLVIDSLGVKDGWALRHYTLTNGETYTFVQTLLPFAPGSMPGQNVQLYYPSPPIANYAQLFDNRYTIAITYKKQVTTKSGDIIGDDEFVASPILTATNFTTRGTDYPTDRLFNVVEYNISQCSWPQDTQ